MAQLDKKFPSSYGTKSLITVYVIVRQVTILSQINLLLIHYFFQVLKAVPLHATKALGWRGIAPTHSRPRH
jgi:hypothetical protein